VVTRSSLLSGGNFFVKEATSASVLQHVPKSDHFLFKSPQHPSEWPEDVLRENRYLRDNIYMIPFDSGHVAASMVPVCLEAVTRGYERIYSKGMEMCALLSQLIGGRRVLDLGTVGCPSFTHMRLQSNQLSTCHLHHYCTQTKAYHLHTWIEEMATRGEEVVVTRSSDEEEEEDVPY